LEHYEDVIPKFIDDERYVECHYGNAVECHYSNATGRGPLKHTVSETISPVVAA
jgi:hypothetical protein